MTSSLKKKDDTMDVYVLLFEEQDDPSIVLGVFQTLDLAFDYVINLYGEKVEWKQDGQKWFADITRTYYGLVIEKHKLNMPF